MRTLIALVVAYIWLVIPVSGDDHTLIHYDRVTIQQSGGVDSLVSIKDIPFGESIRLKIALVNTTGESITIDQIKLSCNCTSLKTFDKEVQAMGTGNLELQVNSEERDVRPTTSSTATLYFKDSGVQTIRFRISYKEMICFSQSRAELSFGEQSREVVRRIPITISEDIKLEDYRLELSDPLRHLSAKLLNNNFGAHVEIRCNGLEHVQKRDVGTISILKKDEVIDICSVGLSKHQPIRLTPSTIVFEREDAKSGFVGNALLRIESDGTNEGEVTSSFSIKSADGADLRTELTRIGKGTYRVKVFSLDVLDKLPIKWSLRPTSASDYVRGELKTFFP